MSEKNDDTLKDGNHDDLEARVVAWVLGEASPFEAEQLARLTAEKPELSIFKRRIAAAHGLLGEAARPVREPLRLSPERRGKLLAAIGAPAKTAENPAVVFSTKPVNQRRRFAWRRWIAPMAACVTLGLLLGTVVISTLRDGLLGAKLDGPSRREHIMHISADADSMAPAEPSLRPPSPEKDDRRVVFQYEQPDKQDATTSQSSAYISAPISAVGSGASALDAAKKQTASDEWKRALERSQITDSALSAGAISLRPAASSPPMVAQSPNRSSLADRGRVGSAGLAVGGKAVGRDFGSLEAAKESLSSRSSTAKDDTANRVQPPTFEVMSEKLLNFDIRKSGARENEEAQRKQKASLEKNEALKFGVDVRNDYAAPGSSRVVGPTLDAKRAAPAEDDAPKPQPPPRVVDESLREEMATETQPVSTFSLHVSDASFRLARAALARGERPDASSIRPEEFYNAFDYGDPAPSAGEPVACRIEQSAHPFLQQRNLVRIAVRVPAAGRGAGQPLRLTVMVDTSGSMEREDRAATVRRAFEVLASLLGPDDLISVIGFARQPRLLADRVPGNQAAGLAEFVSKTPAEGGTNLEEALELAEKLALRQRLEGAQNRIVLLTDGAANLGNADPAQLSARITRLRQQGIAFDACGVGADGLDDRILEALTRQGDGRYQVLNAPEEADDGFARKLAGAFRPAAENVKAQVRFNSARVKGYRLIGFEQHRLREEDFRNDKVDAAELASEEAAVALYQVEALPEGEGELGEVFIRFRDAATGQMVERSWTLAYSPQAPAFARASPAMKLAGASAFLAEKLRGGSLAGQIRFEEFAPVISDLRGAFSQSARAQELATMFAQARRLIGE